MSKKYPDTDTFTFFNANPKRKVTSDCVIRAVCTLLDEPYDDVTRDMVEFGLAKGYAYNDPKCIDLYLKSKGYTKQKQPRKADNTKYTGAEFCKVFKGRCVANIGGHHIVYISGGKVFDIWNSTSKCIGNYWTKA